MRLEDQVEHVAQLKQVEWLRRERKQFRAALCLAVVVVLGAAFTVGYMVGFNVGGNAATKIFNGATEDMVRKWRVERDEWIKLLNQKDLSIDILRRQQLDRFADSAGDSTERGN